MQFNSLTIDHKGKPFHLPFTVYEATSVNLYSLLDYDTACLLCEQENYQPIIINTEEGKRAAGVVAAIDYKKTSACPYHEWSLGIFVSPGERKAPEVDFVNETSLFFQSMLDDEQFGNFVFCPKLILDEVLPTEIGFDYYGLPKELGEVEYNYTQRVSDFSAAQKDGSWIMKASFPTRRGVSAKLSLLMALFKAYGIRQMIRSLGKKKFLVTLTGSRKVLAKNANMEIKLDPKTEMFPWDNQDCKVEINPDNQWGNILLKLKLQPKLICHVPNLQFKLSEPLDQKELN